MQVIGRSCTRCGDSIVSVLEASWCSACDAAFHRRCIDHAERCPQCERPFAESQQADREHGERETAALLRSGKNTVLVATILFGISRSVIIAFTCLGGALATPTIVRHAAFALVGMALLVAAYLGLRWVRLYLQLAFGFSVVLQAIVLLSLAQSEAPVVARTVSAALVCMILAVDAFVLYTFLFSQSVRRFVEYQEFENVR